MDYLDLIAAKRAGKEHYADELAWLARSAADGTLTDSRLSAWIMAAVIQGLSDREAHRLAVAMRDAGRALPRDWPGGPRADKHSTGGVGDKVSLAVVPIAAACGVSVLKLTGRALGFTGGTADKLEAAPGVRTDLSLDSAYRQVEAIGAAFVVQTADWAPADKRMYALRDEIGAIDSIPLIAASIMSKKLAAGAGTLVLDVKVGAGTFMTRIEDARRLAQLMVKIGRSEGVRTEALLTDMDTPLGRSIGTGLELAEAWHLLLEPDAADPRLRELSESVAVAMISSALEISDGEARHRVQRALRSGAGAQRLADILTAQGGRPSELAGPHGLPRAPVERALVSPTSGFVAYIEPRTLGALARQLAADHPGAGILLTAALGQSVRIGDPLARVRAADPAAAARAAVSALQAFHITQDGPLPRPVVLERVGGDGHPSEDDLGVL